MDAFLAAVDARYRLMFKFLAATELRISELIALRWDDVALTGARPHVRVRRQLYRGRLEPPKSRRGRRDVPLDKAAVAELRKRKANGGLAEDDLVFASQAGTPLYVENVRRRMLRYAAKEAAAPWSGFHTFRHTCASLLFQRGANAVQVQRWLGHHSAAFTLATYVHLMDNDLGEPLSVAQGECAGLVDFVVVDSESLHPNAGYGYSSMTLASIP